MARCRFCTLADLRWVDLNNPTNHVPGPMEVMQAPRWQLQTQTGERHYCNTARQYYTALKNNDATTVATMDALHPRAERPAARSYFQRPIPPIFTPERAAQINEQLGVETSRPVDPLEQRTVYGRIDTNRNLSPTSRNLSPSDIVGRNISDGIEWSQAVSEVIAAQRATGEPHTIPFPVTAFDVPPSNNITFVSGGWLRGHRYQPREAVRYMQQNWVAVRVNVDKEPPSYSSGGTGSFWIKGNNDLHLQFTGHDLPPGSACLRTQVSKKVEEDINNLMQDIESGKRNIKLD